MKFEGSFIILLIIVIPVFLLKIFLFSNIYEGYTSGAGYMFVNIDELSYYNKAIDISNSFYAYGVIYTITHFYDFTGSYHAIYYFILSLFHLLFGNENFIYSFIFFKTIVISLLTLLLLHKFLIKHLSKKNVFIGCVFFIFYPPMIMYSFSLMRDDLILFSMLYFFFTIDKVLKKKSLLNIFLFVLSLVFLMQLRTNLLVFSVAILLALHFKDEELSKKNIVLISTVLLLSILPLFIFLKGYIEILLRGIPSIYDITFSLIKIIFSPLPWSLSTNYNFVFYWVWLSFFINAALFLYPLRIIQGLIEYRYFFLSVILFYCLPYIIRDGGLGFRQFTLIAPIVVPFFYSKSLDAIKIK